MWAKYVIWTMFAWVIWVIKFHNWTRLLCIANVPKLFVLNMFAHEAHVSKPKLSPLVLNNRMWRITRHFTKRSLYRSPASPSPTLGTRQYCYTLCSLSVTYQLPDCKAHLSTTSQKITYTNSHFFFKSVIETEILGKFVYIFCFILLFTSPSPCRKNQFAFLWFSKIFYTSPKCKTMRTWEYPL